MLIEQLLTHTSGLPREPQSFTSIAPKNSFMAYSMEAFQKDFSEVELINDNIGVFDYSNYGYIILGQIVDVVSNGIDFKDLLRDKVIQPLGLSQTKFDLSEIEMKKLCKGHSPELEVVEPYLDLGPMYSSAGALITTTKEMLEFCKILTGEVKAESEMAEIISEVTKIRIDSNGFKYSLGLHVREIDNDVYLYHPGNIAGHKCSVIVSTTSKKALVYNTDTLHHVRIVWDLIHPKE